MKRRKDATKKDIIEYQPDAVEIEEKPVAGKIRWVLYIILLTLVVTVTYAAVVKVDRIIVADGSLITTSPPIVVQPLNTATIRSINAQVGDIVEKGQILATLDSTFTSADLNQLKRKQLSMETQLRRIDAELSNSDFKPRPKEGEDGRLQESLFNQRKTILQRTLQMKDDKKAALESQRALNRVKRQGSRRQLKLLRDVEGTTAKMPQNGNEYRLRLLESQKARYGAADEIESLKAEEEVIVKELRKVESEWQQFLEERSGELMEEKVRLRDELKGVVEEINKAERLQELVSLRAPQRGIVLKMAERSMGSILRQAEPFATLVPVDCRIEAEVRIKGKDIARIRKDDAARVKLDAFPFQKHGTLDGEVRVISEDAFQHPGQNLEGQGKDDEEEGGGFYLARVRILNEKLKKVPEGFRLMPGMKVRTEIKVGKRRVISYFLYPIIRALDESLREP